MTEARTNNPEAVKPSDAQSDKTKGNRRPYKKKTKTEVTEDEDIYGE
jgi:hypothetical protein